LRWLTEVEMARNPALAQALETQSSRTDVEEEVNETTEWQCDEKRDDGAK